MLFFVVFFSPFSIAITSLGEERANLNDLRLFGFVCFLFPWCLGRMRLVIVAFLGLFSYLFCIIETFSEKYL